MKKTHKKIENNLRINLSQACEEIKIKSNEFQWLTHQVDYDKFPQSLVITCYFNSRESMEQANASALKSFIHTAIIQHLSVMNIRQFHAAQQIRFAIAP